MSCSRRRFLLPSLIKPFEASIIKMALASRGMFLIEHEDAGGDAGAVKQVGRQPDDPFQIPGTNKPFADGPLRRHETGHRGVECRPPLPALFIERMMCSR